MSSSSSLVEPECPFYEETGGTYWQGCWEYVDICWLAPDLGSNANCYDSCPIRTQNESGMIQMCLIVLKEGKIQYNKYDSPTLEKLEEFEINNIIRDMDRIYEYFNQISDPKIFYK